MNSWHYSRQRSEIVLAVVRILLAIFAVVALALQPDSARVRFASVLGFAYFFVALVLLFVVQRPTFKQPWRVRVHLADLSFATVFLLLTRPGSMLEIGFVVFPLLASSLRFRWRAIFFSSIPIIGAAVAANLASLDEIGIHAAVLHTIAALFSAAVAMLLAAYHGHIRDLSALLWSGFESGEDNINVLRDVLEHAAVTLNVPRVLLVWEDEASARYEIALFTGSEVDRCSESTQLTAPSLDGVDFFCGDLDLEPVITDAGEEFSHDGAVTSFARARFGIRSVISCDIAGRPRGRMFFLDPSECNADALALARAMTDVVAIRLLQSEILRRDERAAVSLERSRIARDLHDGLLQSLTGASLQLEAARVLIDSEPSEAKELLREVQEVLLIDQHEVRHFVDSLRMPAPRSGSDLRTGAAFSALAAIVRRQWGAEVDVRIDALQTALPRTRRREIQRIIREAVFNAARHGGARRITVEGTKAESSIEIVVTDDGSGFPFQGRYDLAALDAMRCGPVTVKERVQHLGGDLVLHSSRFGARLEISVPLTEAESYA